MVPENVGGAWSCRMYEEYEERLTLVPPIAVLSIAMMEDDDGSIHGVITPVSNDTHEPIMPEASFVQITGRRNNYAMRADDILITVPVDDKSHYLLVLNNKELGRLDGAYFLSMPSRELKDGGLICSEQVP